MGSNRPHRHTLLEESPCITTWVATLNCPIVCVFLLCVLFMHKPTTHHHAVGSNIDNIINVHLLFSNVYNYTLSLTPMHTVTCSPPCVNGACVLDNVCACSQGYTGPTCNTPVYSLCSVNPCGQDERCGLLAGSHYCGDCPAGGNSGSLLCQLTGELESANVVKKDTYWSMVIGTNYL